MPFSNVSHVDAMHKRDRDEQSQRSLSCFLRWSVIQTSTLFSAGSSYDWSSWSSCSVTCGTGEHRRIRLPCDVRVEGSCPDDYPTTEYQQCNKTECRSTYELIISDSNFITQMLYKDKY